MDQCVVAVGYCLCYRKFVWTLKLEMQTDFYIVLCSFIWTHCTLCLSEYVTIDFFFSFSSFSFSFPLFLILLLLLLLLLVFLLLLLLLLSLLIILWHINMCFATVLQSHSFFL